MPSISFNAFTTKSLLSLKESAIFFIKSCVPLSASTDAAWLIDEGLVVDCDWIFAIALTTVSYTHLRAHET